MKHALHRWLAPVSGLLLCVLALEANAAQAGRDPYQHFFNDTFGDFQEELARARDEGKQGVLLFFEMDECPFCHRMKQSVLNQPEVQAYFREHFLSFPVDIEGDIEVVTFAGETMAQKEFAFDVNRVRATPVFAFYDLEGEQVVRYTGATSGVDEFMWLGEFFVEGHYEEMPFARYKREKRRESRRR